MTRFRSLGLLAVVLSPWSTACASDDPAHPPRDASSAEAVSVATAAPSASPAEEAPDAGDDQVEADVRLMVGGMFAVDHIGPEKYEQVNRRFEARPRAYVSEAVRLARTLEHRRLASVFIPSLLERAARHEPEATRAAAQAMLPLYRRAIQEATASPSDEYERKRLEERLRAVERLAR